MSSITNAKELVVNTAIINSQIIRDLTSWNTFYNGTALIQDLGETVKTHKKTYRLYETANGILFSNGIYYDKDIDVLFTPDAVYKDWYAKLLLGYNIIKWFTPEYYANKMMWFTVISSDTEAFSVVRNNIINLRGLIANPDVSILRDSTMLEAMKNIIVWKNVDTYVTQKIEKLQPHEMWYSARKCNKTTVFSRDTYFNDFSSQMITVSNRLGFDSVGISSLATGCLQSAYGADLTGSIPLFVDSYDDTLWHGWLGWEYLLNYKYSDYSATIELLNADMSDTYGLDVDMMKYILPQIAYYNCNSLSQYDKYLGVCNRDAILVDNAIQQQSILSISNSDGTYTINYMIDSSEYSTDIDISTFKSDFFTIFTDLSSSDMSDFIDSISNQDSLYGDETAFVPIIIMDASSYSEYGSASKFADLYCISVVFYNIINASNTISNQFKALESNILALDISSYINIAGDARYTTYVEKMISLNIRFGVAPLYTEVFNPSILDEISSIANSISEYSSGGFESDYDESTFNLADPDCKIEFDETSTVDDTRLFFISQSFNNLDYAVFFPSDTTKIQYMNFSPEYVLMAELDASSWRADIDDFKLQFENDNTRLQYVPVDLEESNIASIPYKGLVLLSDITDAEKIQLTDLWIQRDSTSNLWKCKIQLLTYDNQDLERVINFKLYGGNSLTRYQQIAYEFGLGFQLVSSENVDNLEIMRILYIIMSQTQSNNNIFVEQVMQDPAKLKMLFKKLTASPITLRTVIGYTNDESIVDTIDFTV